MYYVSFYISIQDMIYLGIFNDVCLYEDLFRSHISDVKSDSNRIDLSNMLSALLVWMGGRRHETIQNPG